MALDSAPVTRQIPPNGGSLIPFLVLRMITAMIAGSLKTAGAWPNVCLRILLVAVSPLRRLNAGWDERIQVMRVVRAVSSVTGVLVRWFGAGWLGGAAC